VSWTTIRDVRAFLAEEGTVRVREHNFSRRILHWPYCAYCGLVMLKNERSRKAAKAPCVTRE
jgi:hypothetical protein